MVTGIDDSHNGRYVHFANAGYDINHGKCIQPTIHYCWFGGSALPREVKRCISSWKEYCPNFDIIRWDESNFDLDSNLFCKTAYRAKAWAFVSDYARLKIVFENGGIYLDTDVEILKSFDDLRMNRCFVGVCQIGRLCTTGLGFGAVQGSPIVREMLMQYENLVFDWKKAKELACPMLNDRVVRTHGYAGDGMGEIELLDEVTVYPCRYFDPLTPGESNNLLCDDTYSIHHYSNSWGSTKDVLRRKLIRMVGTDRVAKLKEAFRG